MARTKDPLLRATTRADVAVRHFLDAADELEAAAEELTDIALDSEYVSDVMLQRAGTARSQAAQAEQRAARIRELLG